MTSEPPEGSGEEEPQRPAWPSLEGQLAAAGRRTKMSLAPILRGALEVPACFLEQDRLRRILNERISVREGPPWVQ